MMRFSFCEDLFISLPIDIPPDPLYLRQFLMRISSF